MAIDAINVLIRSGDAQAVEQAFDQQKEGQEFKADLDRSAKAKQKLDQKVKEHSAQVKGGQVQRDVVSRTDEVRQKFEQYKAGAAGPEVAMAAQAWDNNGSVQNKLNEAQKQMFREAMANNPPKAAQAANAFVNLTELGKQVGDPRQQPPAQKTLDQKATGQQTPADRALAQKATGQQTPADKTLAQKATGQQTPEGVAKPPTFDRAINDSRLAGSLQKGLIANPEVEKPVGDLLRNPLFQSQKTDRDAKKQFLEFGMRAAAKGQGEQLKQTHDIMGTLHKAKVGAPAQREVAKALPRNADKLEGLSKGLDQLVSDPNIGKLPTFARTKAVELLAKSNGDQATAESFQKLSADPTLKKQTAENKGRFFTTIGSGRPSEQRAIADKLLQSLKPPPKKGAEAGADPAALRAAREAAFPTRSGPVTKLLAKVSQQVQQDGAAGIDMQAAMRAAKQPATPKLTLVKDDPIGNRGKIGKWVAAHTKNLDDYEKKLDKAKYLEDINKLPGLQMPEDPDLSVLTPEELQYYAERKEALARRQKGLRDGPRLERDGKTPKLGPNGEKPASTREKMRLLRTKRRPGGRKGEMQARVRGQQPRYFSPQLATRGGKASQAFAQATGTDGQPQGLPPSAARAQFGQRSASAAAQNAGDPIQQQIARALSGLGSGPLTADKAGMVAQAIGQQVAQQVAKELMRQTSGRAAAGEMFAVPEETAHLPDPQTQARKAQQGKVDGWGIPRSFERDLGGADRVAVKPPVSQEAAMEEAVVEKYTGRTLIKDQSAIRQLGDLFASRWKDLSRPEMALLKNLGWGQQMWDTKDTAAAKWPGAMVTAFVNLSPLQREAIRKLGFTPGEWDKRVQAMASGRNT